MTAVSSLFLLSLASGMGPPTLTHLELGPSLSNDAGQRQELADECGKVLILEEEAKTTREECDRLWHELQEEVEVSEAGQTVLAERGQELAVAWAEL